jgi:hypothetical protein
MSDDVSRPTDPEAPLPPPAAPAQATEQAAGQDVGQTAGQSAGQPAYAMPLPAGYPAYAVPPRPRFADQVLGMRAVVATALICLIVGGLLGFVLGRATGDDHGRFGGPGPGFFQRRGDFPNGPGTFRLPNGQTPNGQSPGTRNGIPQQRFDGTNPNRTGPTADNSPAG